MSIIEKKEKNLNLLINKLNTLSLTYSQPTYEIEKIKTEKNELIRQKLEIEKKNQDLMKEHKFLKDKISFDDISIKLKQLINNKIFLKYRRKKVNNLTQIEKLNEFVRLKTKTLSVISKFK